MRNRCPYALLYAATHAVRADNDTKPVEPFTPACGCCQRPWDVVEDPGMAYPYRYASGMATEFLCSTCYTPRVAAQNALGVERRAGKSSLVYGKLGMLPGSGGVVTDDGVLYLALPKGFVSKFGGGVYGQLGQIHEIGPGVRPLDVLLSLIRRGDVDVGKGFLYFDLWGRKPDELMRGLRLTYSLSELWCNSESGPFSRDLLAHVTTARELNRQGISELARKPAFWNPIRKAATGTPLDELAGDMEKWVTKIPDPEALLSVLPVNPHDRCELPSMMKSLLPLLEESPGLLDNAS